MNEITQALFAAARQGNVPVLQEIFPLIDNVDVRDERGFTPLIIAAYNNQPGAVAALLDAGADPNLADSSGNTALMGASFKGHAGVACVLVTRGSSLDAQHGNGGTALMFGRNNVVELLLEYGASADVTDVRGLTALDLALQQGNSAAADALQQHAAKQQMTNLSDTSNYNLL